MQRKDYYVILGIARDADESEIKIAYRKLALQNHPDMNRDDPHAEDRFKGQMSDARLRGRTLAVFNFGEGEFAQAQEEANRTLAKAREKSEQMVERDAIVQAAQARADQIIAQARAEIEADKHEADDYAVETLTRLEMELDRYLTQVRNGIRTLQNNRPAEKSQND